MTLSIQPPDTHLDLEIKARIDNKTKPPGSLGVLEEVAFKLGRIQRSLEPEICKPTMLVFAGDHGIVAEGVSPFPQAVTRQMVQNYLAGGAAINVFARLNGWDLRVVDAGVNAIFDAHPNLLDRKIGMGTSNYLHGPAMTATQREQAFEHGRQLVAELAEAGCNTLAFGEMGIGNTSSAALLMHLVLGDPLDQCVGRGTGLDDFGLEHKRQVLARALENNGKPQDAYAAIQVFGGFELAMICGAMLEAGRRNMLILIDGFIVTATLLVALTLEPHLIHYCLFSHKSEEKGHCRMLDWLNARPLLNLDLRLGEGTGAALALPLVRAAVGFLGEMASFESAGVSNRG